MANWINICFLLLIALGGCAKIGTPTGGPKDVLPPEYLSASPPNRSLNFSDDQIDINFNEYIQLKDQNKEIIVSPPMNAKPVIRVREKSLRVSFNEDLLTGTTYTINFGKSISDLNESNLLPDFEFVFSTGDNIDSLSVTGKVVESFTNEPNKDISMFVMLYENLSDSAPLNEIPRYYTRANQDGLFAINNISADTFRIIALNDANNNLKYDPGLERIAFSDSLIVVNPGTVKEQMFIKDTIKIITPAQISVRANRRDTTSVADTVIAPGKKLNAVSISLLSFIEEANKVIVTSRTRDIPEQFIFTFNRPLFDTLSIEPLNFTSDSNWILTESSKNNDTLTYWITDTTISKLDTLRLRLTYETTDSAGFRFSKSDTIRLRKPTAAAAGNRGGGSRRSREDKPVNKLEVTANIAGRGTLNLNSNMIFTASRPIRELNADSIVFGIYQDTLFVNQQINLNRQVSSMRRFAVSSQWKEDSQYRILLKPGAVRDIYGNTNDSLEIRFSTRPLDYYGRVLMNFSGYTYPMILQVRDEKGNIVKTTLAEKAGLITFDYLAPGRYSFKAIHDANKNGKWDTGNYLKKLQPEKTYISGKPQQLRSNWDWETEWNIIENSAD